MDKKNIIIIVVDAFRPKNLSLFGYNKETDTCIKKIAQENINFTNCFSSANSTAPSVTSILTGKNPNHHGILHQLPYTEPQEMEKVKKEKFWLPEYLQNKGYETMAVDWLGLWFKRGFNYYGEGTEQGIFSKPNSPFISSEQTIELAKSKIQKSTKPFFLFLHFWDTHFPFPNTDFNSEPNSELLEQTLNLIQDPNQREYLRKRTANRKLNTIQDMINKYDASIIDVDKQIGALRNFLEIQELWDNTLVFILGDHGVNLTGHGICFSPSGLFDDSLHVPFIVHLPGVEKKQITEFVQNIDIVPTILDYLNLETNEIFDGKSLLPLIQDNKILRDKVFFSDGLCSKIKGVRTKTRKLIIAENNFCHLCKGTHHEGIEEYDLINDPKETKNIFSGESELMKFLE